MSKPVSDLKMVYILDDNDDFRRSTAWMLEAYDYEVMDFDSAEPALDAMARHKRNHLECLLLDVRMPGMSGLDVHDILNSRGIVVPVVYMTGHADVPLAVEAMKKGAITFLEKPLQTEALEKALDAAFVRSRNNTMAHTIDVLGSDLESFTHELEKLTPRETEIMHAIVDGKANKATAYDLGISSKTVELHRARVMKKLPVSSAQELVKMVLLCR